MTTCFVGLILSVIPAVICAVIPAVTMNQTYDNLIHWCSLYSHTCCDMGQDDTIGKIELNPSFALSSKSANSRNDIQKFLKLFDEHKVNGDCN